MFVILNRPIYYYVAATQYFSTDLKTGIKGKRSSVCVRACVYLLDFSKIISLISSYSVTSAERKQRDTGLFVAAQEHQPGLCALIRPPIPGTVQGPWSEGLTTRINSSVDGFLIFATASKPAEVSRPFIQWLPTHSPYGIKQPECSADDYNSSVLQ